MSEAHTLPALKLALKPSFDSSTTVTGRLHVTLTISNLDIKTGGTLLTFETKSKLAYIENTLSLHDGDGPLEFDFTITTDNFWECRLRRGSFDDVRVEFEILTDPGDHGVLDVGRRFLPKLGLSNSSYHNIVEWNLANAPDDTRAVCSFGEGPQAVFKDGSPELILNSIYMVGQIKSDPALGQESSHRCGTYWFGNLPAKIVPLTNFTLQIFSRMADHFRDQDGGFNLFFREVPTGFGGRESSFADSCLFEYDSSVEAFSDFEMVRMLTPHIILNWVGLDSDDDGLENDWYSKGLAQMYSVFLPFRFGQRSPDYFKETLNAFLLAYYTNTQISLSLRNRQTLESDWYGKHVTAFRGMLYCLKMDSYSRRASRERNAGVLRPIDGIVADICVRQRQGEKIGTKDWIRYLGEWIGEEAAEQYFEDMINGKVLEMDDMKSSFGESHEPVPMELETLDLGMDPASFEMKIVSGLVAGSRAEIAGLRDGDKIVSHSNIDRCVTNFNERINIKIERGDVVAVLEYWPRSWTTTRCWQVVKITEH